MVLHMCKLVNLFTVWNHMTCDKDNYIIVRTKCTTGMIKTAMSLC